MTQSDLEWPRTAVDKAWMTQYDFRWVKSISEVQSNLDIQWLSVRERPPYWVGKLKKNQDLDLELCCVRMIKDQSIGPSCQRCKSRKKTWPFISMRYRCSGIVNIGDKQCHFPYPRAESLLITCCASLRVNQKAFTNINLQCVARWCE